jgi:thymidylate synthase
LEYDYLDLLDYVLDKGEDTENRTGVRTRSVFGAGMAFDLQAGFPAVTTKKIAWKAVVSELLWFLEGSTDERRLCEILHGTRDPSKNTIWRANADTQGVELGYVNTDDRKYLGPVYGAQWRNFNGVDQISNLIDEIRAYPQSRRLILSAWNPVQLEDMALPPCHVLSQFAVRGGKIHCQMYQRSADLPLGSPFNIASYSLLTHIIASITGYDVGYFNYVIGDAHIYHNQFDGVIEQIGRDPFPFPTLRMPKFRELSDVLAAQPSDFVLEGYKHHPPIKMPFAV